MRVGLVVLGVLVSGCGEPQSTVTSELRQRCPLASGSYVSEATLRDKVGTCAFEKPFTRDRLVFEEGAYVSPAAVLIPCSTEQVECSLNITCQVLDLTMVFEGELAEDAQQIVGTVTFTGRGDCRLLSYDLVATLPQPTP